MSLMYSMYVNASYITISYTHSISYIVWIVHPSPHVKMHGIQRGYGVMSGCIIPQISYIYILVIPSENIFLQNP